MMTYDRKDRLQEQWLQANGLAAARTHAPRHFLPSNFGYVRACEIGMGWGMHPEVLICRQLQDGALVPLLAHSELSVPLYWAHPRSAQAGLERLTQCVMAAARQWLEPAAARPA